MPRHQIAVLKFGSSVLSSEDDLPSAVHEVYRWVRQGYRVVAVVSALGDTTDRLLEQARRFGECPDEEALAALVETGELTSAALLSLALDRAGVPSAVFDSSRLNLRTVGPVLDASPDQLDENVVHQAFESYPVLVVPGFVGRTESGAPSLLGRGGSDLTAIFLAERLEAQFCRLIKDVNGLYESDPALGGPDPRRYQTLSWDEALQLGGGIVQPKAIQFAKDHKVPFEVSASASADSTLVGSDPASFFAEEQMVRPLRIGLLGLGTVGLGVYRQITAMPDLFEITGIAVRDSGKERDAAVPEKLLTIDPWQVIEKDCDVVVELIGGDSLANELIASALRSGCSVVTANKSVISQHGSVLSKLANEADAQLSFSAAAGGAVPIIEAVERLANTETITRIEGVINGTTTFILDRLSGGGSFEEAVRVAQENGFAEADPSFDLDGIDAAQKLCLLAQAGFGIELGPEQITCTGIRGITSEDIDAARKAGNVIRLVGTIEKSANGITTWVGPKTLPESHPLARTIREQNCIVVEVQDGGSHLVRGKGAGRWPTTEAVMADLFDLVRGRQIKAQQFELPSDAQPVCAGGVQ